MTPRDKALLADVDPYLLGALVAANLRATAQRAAAALRPIPQPPEPTTPRPVLPLALAAWTAAQQAIEAARDADLLNEIAALADAVPPANTPKE